METRIKFEMDFPKEISLIHQIFKQENFDLFLIGGCVRDAFLGIKPKDFDLVTNATPDKVIELLKNQPFVSNILHTGIAFGVINVIANGQEFEIATMREDVGIGRRPDSVIFTNIKIDVLRRDLTCNALFFDLDTSELVDLVGGLDDLKKGIVRTVGNAEDRFNEDRLRILRAIRFAARFGSGLDIDIVSALHKNASLEGISAERIRDEFLKGIKSAKSVIHFLELLDAFDLFDWIFKDLSINRNFLSFDDPIIVISALLLGNDVDMLKKDLNKLTYSINEIKAITFLLSLNQMKTDSGIFKLKKNQKNAGVTNFQIMVIGSLFDISPRFLNLFIRFKLTVTGESVMEKFNLEAGPIIGETIEKLEMDNFKKMLNSVTF